MMMIGNVSESRKKLMCLFTSVCRALHFCKTDSGNDRVLYRNFISGLISAFFGYYLQGSTAMLSYVVNETNIPVVVGNFESDTNC